MKVPIIITLLVAIIGFSTTSEAFLFDRGAGMIYDSDLDITWYDFTYGKTSFQNAYNWADSLTIDINGIIIDDWRLPTTVDGFPIYGYAGPNSDGTYSYTFGYNLANSEMGHLYYTELGNEGHRATDGTWPQPPSQTNTGPFNNLPTDDTWSGTEHAHDSGQAWYFNFNGGSQYPSDKNYNNYAIAVRDGDVGPIPKPPLADAGPNVLISSENQGTTVIHGSASDPDGDPTVYRWIEGATELASWQDVVNGEAYLNLSTVPFFDTGQHTLTLEVSDGKDTVTDDMILTVDNSPPHAAPSGSGVYEINTEVILGGSVSDFDGDTLYYEWMEGTNVLYSDSIDCIKEGTPVTLPTYSIWNLGLGTYTITLQVDDGVNEPVSSDIMVEIVDTGVPTLAPVCNQLILWPPNHRMVDIHIEANASDDSGLPVTLDAEVICDEPEDGLGDGDMAPDWTQPIIDQESGIIDIQLRAERSGSGDGREYTIVITCTDLSGNSSTANVNVIVPHDKKK